MENNANSSGNFAFIAVSSAIKSQVNTEWYMDSGASQHMCKERDLFCSFIELKTPKHVKIGDGTTLQAQGQGNICILAYNGVNFHCVTLYDVLFVPQLKVNLFSQGKALDKGFYLISDAEKAQFVNKENITVAMATRSDKLFNMIFKECSFSEHTCQGSSQIENCYFVRNNHDLEWWHKALGHQNLRYVKSILSHCNIEIKQTDFLCESCIQGKHCREPFTANESRASDLGELLHVDLCGPMEEPSLNNSHYMLLLKDDLSNYRFVYFIKNKSDVYDKLKEFLIYFETQTGKKVKVVRSDNGTEFLNFSVKNLFKKYGIKHECTVPYTPQQNGRAEREFRTIIEAVRAMLADSKLSKVFWAEAANTAVFLLNRTGISPIKGKTPYELLFRKSFDIKTVKGIFGSKVWAYIPKEKRKKLDMKSKQGFFVGYSENVKGYRVYYEKENKVSIEREITFTMEKALEENSEQKFVYLDVDTTENILENSEEDDLENEFENLNRNQENRIQNLEDENLEQDFAQTPLRERNERLRPSGLLKLPQYLYTDYDLSFFSLDVDEPTTYSEAIESKYASRWKEAIEEEMRALLDNDTWQLVEKPGKCEIIDSKWVFKIKKDKEGKISKFKCRLVARGFKQNVLEDVYSPVVRLTTIRAVLAVCVQKGWSIYQMDVCNAFLHGDLKENLYMYLPEGCKINGKVCKLNKAIYGLKKAPLYWYQKFNNFMASEGFDKNKCDNCLYFKMINNVTIYVIIFVDDILISGSCVKEIEKLKLNLNRCFKMKDLGLLNYFLGISVEQNVKNNMITLSQKQYLENILIRFGMSDCKPISTPMDCNFDYGSLKSDKSDSIDIENKCRQIIGCIMYAMLGTRPDLCSSISLLSRYQNCASEKLLIALKRVLRYIRGTLELKLVYKCKSSSVISGYADADWGGDTTDRKSTSGFCLYVYGNIISWNSKKQSTVAISTTEAEIIALSLCISEVCWLRNLLLELKLIKELKVVIYEDNQSAIRSCSSHEQLKRIKHLDIKYHFAKDKINENIIEIKYIPSNEQIADVLTKPLNKVTFEKLRGFMLY